MQIHAYSIIHPSYSLFISVVRVLRFVIDSCVVYPSDEYTYSRQYMYGRRDHGGMQMHQTDKHGQAPWRAGVKRGFYGMYDHYMIG